MIPLFVDCTGRRIVIFGGGEVAARKARYFSGRADLLIVSRSFVPAFDGMPVTRRELDVAAADSITISRILEGSFLVIAALSDPAINNHIGRLCRAAGILFNNADGESGDVMLPAVSSGENYTLAVSTHGNSPAVSRFIREAVERDYPCLDAMITLQDRLRDELKRREPDQKKRTAILTRVLADSEIWKMLASGQTAAWDEVARRYLHE